MSAAPLKATSQSVLQRLHDTALHSAQPALYAGDVGCADAWEYLAHYPAVLVDVRTSQEWGQVGVPDLGATPSKLVQISWKLSPSFHLNPDFAKLVESAAPDKDTPLFFLCKSGGRSLDAAIAMAEREYRHCFNIAHGFESMHGAGSGWKAGGFPWKQG